jgi:hypothetical protein
MRTTEEKLNGNILIAEFMGLDISDYTSYPEELNTCYHPNDLHFHDSFDDLFNVICEIGNITGYELILRADHCYWNNQGDQPTFEDGEYMNFEGGYNNRLNVHEAVVEFIKWFNIQESYE